MSAFGMTRSDATDAVLLANGELLNGMVQNEKLTLRTAHGPIQFDASRVAGIRLATGSNQLDTVLGVNGDRFSGFLEDPELSIELARDQHRSVRREAIRQVVFRMRAEELEGIPHRQAILLRNGDSFRGRLAGAPFEILTSDGPATLDWPDIESIAFHAQPQHAVRIQLRDGTLLEGIWPHEDLTIALDLGATLHIYRDRVALVHGRDGSHPGAPMEMPLTVATVRSVGGAETMAGVESVPLDGMVWIPPGVFVMGSAPDEQGRDFDEGPLTEVTITRGFWMAIHPVTQAQYTSVMGINPSHHTGDAGRPVERVSWHDAMDYCAKLTRFHEARGWLPAGYEFRLPTEAEWEYACRAGTTTRFSHGDDPDHRTIGDYAWFTENSDSSTHPVATRKPNPWGLYDMHGNVFEWCLDSATSALPGGRVSDYRAPTGGTLHVARGGSWLYGAEACRSANRDSYGRSTRCSDLGFRVVLALRPQGQAAQNELGADPAVDRSSE